MVRKFALAQITHHLFPHNILIYSSSFFHFSFHTCNAYITHFSDIYHLNYVVSQHPFFPSLSLHISFRFFFLLFSPFFSQNPTHHIISFLVRKNKLLKKIKERNKKNSLSLLLQIKLTIIFFFE